MTAANMPPVWRGADTGADTTRGAPPEPPLPVSSRSARSVPRMPRFRGFLTADGADWRALDFALGGRTIALTVRSNRSRASSGRISTSPAPRRRSLSDCRESERQPRSPDPR